MLTHQQIIENFVKKVMEKNISNSDKSILLKAITLADKVHFGQLRKSGEPYIVHPIGVAYNLWVKYNDLDLSIGALLHDVVEDSKDIQMSDVYEMFGDKIGFLIDSVTKTKLNFFKNENLIFPDKISKLLYGGLIDVKCLILKIADRENNLVTLCNLGNNKQIRMAFETQAIYYPLKSIIKYNEIKDLSLANNYLREFLIGENISDYIGFKHYLYNKSFKNFNNDTYDLVYKNYNKLVWKIEDKGVLQSLVETQSFDKNIEIINISMDSGGKFCCLFRYKGGQVFDDNKCKLSVDEGIFIS